MSEKEKKERQMFRILDRITDLKLRIESLEKEREKYQRKIQEINEKIKLLSHEYTELKRK